MVRQRLDEVQVAGGRAALPVEHRLIAPWSEKVRYSFKKNGYHGGVTMQEMVVPVTVLSAAGRLAPWLERSSRGRTVVVVSLPSPLEIAVTVQPEPVLEPARPPRKKKPARLSDVDAEPVAAEKPVADQELGSRVLMGRVPAVEAGLPGATSPA